MDNFIVLNNENIEDQHICCAFSDKKCIEGYNLKKDWLKNEFKNGYVFYRLNERAKVFIEYGPIEKAWLPIEGQNFININCFWVSGKYKNQGYGKLLLEKAINDAKENKKHGLVAVVGEKKNHFMSDGKWFLKKGFKVIDQTPDGFMLLMLAFENVERLPRFKEQTKKQIVDHETDITVYYSRRCPFTQYHVEEVLKQTLLDKKLSFEFHKLDTCEEAQMSPTPATIFGLYHKGTFITTDVSICGRERFENTFHKLNIEL